MKGYGFLSIGFILIFIGIALLIIGMLIDAGKARGDVKGGGVVMIGPLPIIFGTDIQSVRIVIVLAAALIILYAIFIR